MLLWHSSNQVEPTELEYLKDFVRVSASGTICNNVNCKLLLVINRSSFSIVLFPLNISIILYEFVFNFCTD